SAWIVFFNPKHSFGRTAQIGSLEQRQARTALLLFTVERTDARDTPPGEPSRGGSPGSHRQSGAGIAGTVGKIRIRSVLPNGPLLIALFEINFILFRRRGARRISRRDWRIFVT